ncbi:MAG: carbonic anhydrase, partial [Planctomycetota bacterium]
VRPAVEASMSDLPGAEDAAVLDRAIALNVHSSVACLKQDSELLRGLLDDGALQVVGAEYSLQTGAVEFFDEGADS